MKKMSKSEKEVLEGMLTDLFKIYTEEKLNALLCGYEITVNTKGNVKLLKTKNSLIKS